jgi:hypothetical protein
MKLDSRSDTRIGRAQVSDRRERGRPTGSGNWKKRVVPTAKS